MIDNTDCVMNLKPLSDEEKELLFKAVDLYKLEGSLKRSDFGI